MSPRAQELAAELQAGSDALIASWRAPQDVAGTASPAQPTLWEDP
jgi:hypothetical protein